MDRPTCGTCLFWDRAGKLLGSCHRHPPTLHVESGPNQEEACWNWPLTAEHDWCGEHDSFWKWIVSGQIEKKA